MKSIKQRSQTVIIGVLVAIIVALVGYIFFDNYTPKSPKVELGIIDSRGNQELDNQIQQALNKEVSSGMASIFLNTKLSVRNSNELVNFLIMNVENNEFIQQIQYVITDTGEVIYESPNISPGYKLEKDYLLVDLEKGTYKCTANINLLDSELNHVNVVKFNVTLDVAS